MCELVKECEQIAISAKCDFAVATAKELTTFKGGGNACVFMPDDVREFVDVYNLLAERGYKPFILGGGSDTVLADGIAKVPVISSKGLNRIRFTDSGVYAECGAYTSKITSLLWKNGCGGFEFLSGVPSTVGGALRMNASAFGEQTADYVLQATVLKFDGEKCGLLDIPRDEIQFGYRKGIDGVVISAVLRTDKADTVKRKALAKQYSAQRKRKQPRLPSCGSVFKNGEQPAGKLIESCGLKGTRIGGAEISEMHGNFIVNMGGATASDFMCLVRLCEESVYDKFGITLEREFVLLE